MTQLIIKRRIKKVNAIATSIPPHQIKNILKLVYLLASQRC
jgi:hypothetical protein